jgi:hypothetical protein
VAERRSRAAVIQHRIILMPHPLMGAANNVFSDNAMPIK